MNCTITGLLESMLSVHLFCYVRDLFFWKKYFGAPYYYQQLLKGPGRGVKLKMTKTASYEVRYGCLID